MIALVVAVFVLTYVGMALGRFPGLKVDRAGIAMIAAVVLAATGAVPAERLVHAVHFPTLLLLAALMILSARVGAAGFYAAAAAWIGRGAHQPLALLALTIGVGGVLSALLVNDVVVFAMTPLLCAALGRRRLDARPFLVGLAAASNAGSAATLIGNPQNIMIGQVGGLGFWSYLAAAAVPALIALVLTFVLVAVVWRREMATPAGDPGTERPPINRQQLGACGVAVAMLLVLFATPLSRELSALMVAALLIVSRTVPTRRLFGDIDVPLLILFAGLFVVNDAFAGTRLAEDAMRWGAAHGLLPDRALILAPLALALSNTIGNVPAVVMLLAVWQDIPAGVLVGLAVLSTLAGNLLLVGSLANLIVAERAAAAGVILSFGDHARVGVPLTLVSTFAAAAWLVAGGWMPW